VHRKKLLFEPVTKRASYGAFYDGSIKRRESQEELAPRQEDAGAPRVQSHVRIKLAPWPPTSTARAQHDA
jgi:hypothetical protein